MLLLFAMLVFGLFAICALTVDMGFASLTQGQMQNATDTGALEGMRWRNTTALGQPDFLVVIPFLTEDHRRLRSSEIMRLTFDEDMTLDGTADMFGAGPVFEVNGGIGDSGASALIDVKQNPVYDDPQIQLNGTFPYNDKSGDLVSGTYHANMPHGEDANYSRFDFVPATHPSAGADEPAFLTRMRRSSEPAVPGVSSSGPPLPFLFGRGSLMQGDGTWSPRSDGLTVRATSIAEAQPAIRVGRSPAAAQQCCWLDSTCSSDCVRGVVPFALDFEFWKVFEVTTNDPECVDVVNGEIRLAGQSTVIGRFVDELTHIGQGVVGVDWNGSMPRFTGWTPIFTNVEGVDRVIGFGFAEIEFENPVGCSNGSISKRASAVALHNASAVLGSEAPDLPKSAWDEIFAARAELRAHQPLMAPVLSR